VEGLVKQNKVVDIYQEYFTGIMTDHSAEVGNQQLNQMISETLSPDP